MPDTPALDSPSRPSRQQLVVPPGHSSWTIAAGAVASGLAGFGLVIGFGIGRQRPLAGSPPPDPLAVAASAETGADRPAPADPAPAAVAVAAEPGLLPPDLAPPTGEQWSTRRDDESPAGRVDTAEPYAARPVSHDDGASELPAPDDPTARPLSRFSSPDLPAAASAVPGGSAPAEHADAAVALADPSRTVDGPPDEMSLETAEASLAGRRSVTSGAAAAAADPEPADEPGPIEPEIEPVEPAAEPPPGPAPQGAWFPPGGELPADEQLAAPREFAPPPAEPVAPAAAESVAAPPPPGFAAAPAFATAPPIGPAPEAAPEAAPARAPALADRAAGPPPGVGAGQGVPGPLQLEGVQTPQLAVEKRGPKEIQVGTAARYEIVVRNVGSATAHDVMLRDAIPRGTSLIATTPPASPAADGPAPAADLVWALGVMPPGGEARVLMELMPEEEGEIGSVASVSFRADATLRSRATKPELTIDCSQPEPVRIGGDVRMTITVANAGSGTATGVVLEAFLPETVSHRAGGELEFDVGRLRPGDSKTIELMLGTRGPGAASARIAARADGGIELDRAVPIPVTAPALEIAVAMPARRFLQRPATCTISMTNAGTAAARSVELACQLPPGMKFVRANNAGWHDERTHRVLWNLEELPAGGTGAVEVVVMPVQAGEQRITAAARSTDGPSDQAVHACQVEGVAALAFQVADSEDPIEVDGLTEYVVRVSNAGTKSASGVRLAAHLLGDLEPVEAEGPGGHRFENLVVEFEPLAKLGPGEEVVYRIRVRGRRAGPQRIQVQLTSADNPTPITKEELTSVYDDR